MFWRWNQQPSHLKNIMKRSYDGKCSGRHDGLPTISGNNSGMATHPPGNGMIPHSHASGNGVLAAALASPLDITSLTTVATTGNGLMSAMSSAGNGVMSTCAPPENGIMATSSAMAGNGLMVTPQRNNNMGVASLMSRPLTGNSMVQDSPPLDGPGPSSSASSSEGAQGSGVSSTSATTSPSGNADQTSPLVAKDEAYWEKRRKNNESAKRSREARRQKETAVAFRALQLERENYVLETQLRYLQADVDQLERQALSVAKPSQSKAVMYANNLSASQDFDNCQYDLSAHSGFQGPPPPPPAPPGSTV